MCINVQKVNYSIDSISGKKILDFSSQHLDRPFITIPCGKCIECLEQRSKDWALRCMIEKKSHKESCIVTLTYKDTDGDLHREDITNFIKRLRKYLDKDDIKIRYFGCGEYGDLGKRPHYHLIIFGWCPRDLRFKFRSNDHKEKFTSKTLEKLWKFGWVLVDPFVDYNSCKYSAKYMQKLNDYGDKPKPFLLYSTRPAIGCYDLEEYLNILVNEFGFYLNGRFCRCPKSMLSAFSKYYSIDEDVINDYKYRSLNYLKKIGVINELSDLDFENLYDFYKKKWHLS